jgi:hypothetical protein
MVAGPAWPTRARALTVVGSLLGAGAVLARPRTPLGTFGYRTWSIYPWWAWVLVAAGVVGGLVMLISASADAGPRRRAAAAVVAVVGAMLGGTGIVAFQHWEPASGMGGYGVGEIPQLERLSLALVVLGACATTAAAWQLRADGELRGHRWGLGSATRVVVGIGVVALLPFSLMLGDLDADPQTWGAIGLIYAGPWGVALVASAWTTRLVAVTLVGTVAGCACLAAIGPQMADLLDASADGRFAALAVGLAALTALSMRTQHGERPGAERA